MGDSPAVQRLLALIKDKQLNSGEELLELSRSVLPDVDDVELGRLNWSPRKNWVENENGLPRYIESVALGIMKSTGYPRERAIPIAINRIKKWAAGLDGVTKKTQMKSVAALALWEKMKASARAKRLKRKK